MDREQRLALERNAHLTVRELAQARPDLVEPFQAALAAKTTPAVAAVLAGRSDRLRALAGNLVLPVPGILAVGRPAVPPPTVPPPLVPRDPGTGTGDGDRRDSDRPTLRAATIAALRERIAGDPLLADDAELAAELADLERGTTPSVEAPPADVDVAEVVGLDEPILAHPEFAPELARARLDLLARATGFEPAVADVLVDDLGSVAQVRDDRLTALVEGGRLTEDQAAAAGRAATLYQVLDERPELVEQLTTRVGDVGELASIDHDGWVEAIEASGTPTPPGLIADTYADLLARKVERLFPTQALATRLRPVQAADVRPDADAVARLRDALPVAPDGGGPPPGPVALGDFAALRADAIPEPERPALRERYERAVRLANSYPGLGLAQVLDDPARSAPEAAAEVARRVGLVDRFLTDNAEAMSLDLTAASPDLDTVTFDSGAGDDDRPRIMATVRGYQRMRAVTDDVDASARLVAAGFHSAAAVADATIDKIAAAADVDATADSEGAKRLAMWREGAHRIAADAATALGTILEVYRGDFGITLVGNESPAIADYLKEIPGFADLFGSQDFCRCTHCRSILGPAAYLYDLMSFVEDTVTRVHFSGRPNHPLALRSRRPDLWTLQLTCENTNKVLAYLTVINEVLENAVAADSGYTGSTTDRAAVEAHVYAQTMPAGVDSFQQPFNLPFEELKAYLRHFDRNLGDLGEAGGATGDTLARLRLALAPRDFELITQPDDTVATLNRVYGVTFTAAGQNVNPVEAGTLLGPMGVTRDELGELLATRAVSGGTTIRIVATKSSSDSVQNDVERLTAATRAALDRLHRFVRLWQATGWRIGELDLVLTAAAGAGPVLGTGQVAFVAAVHRLAEQLNASVEEVVGLVALMPEDPVLRSLPAHEDTDVSSVPAPSPLAWLTVGLLHREFNPPGLAASGTRYPDAAIVFVHPAIATTPAAAAEQHLRRLQAGAGTDEDQLYQLVVGLAVPLGIDPTASNDAAKGFALSRRNLTLLWRHARLARLLGVSVQELLALAALAPEIGQGFVDGLDDLEALLRMHDWARSARWTLAELVEIVRPGTASGPATASGNPPTLAGQDQPAAAELAVNLVDGITQQGTLVFADTVFALVPATAPVVTSRAAVTGTTAGQTVTVQAAPYGRQLTAETVTFAANADLDAVVADWNAKSTTTKAYRADQAGRPATTGDRLALTTVEGTGSDTALTVTTDPANLFIAPAAGPVQPLVRGGAEITEAQSRQIVAANAASFEVVGQGRLRLAAGFDPAAALSVPAAASLDPVLEPALPAALLAYHTEQVLLSALPGVLTRTPAVVAALVGLLGTDLGTPALFAELRGDNAPTGITALIDDLRRLATLFADANVFTPERIAFVGSAASQFGVTDFERVGTAGTQAVERFRALLASWVGGEEPVPDLEGVVRRFTAAGGFAPADRPELARLLGCQVGLVRSLEGQLPLGGTALEALERLGRAVEVTSAIRTGGALLGLVRSTVYARLAEASAAVQAAVRIAFEDERAWERAVEPYQDALRSRRRDALVAYMLRSAAAPFNEPNDLYHYYLLDVQLEGCARTSRVAAAIDSVQLYVQRCLMNYEESPAGAADPVHVLPGTIPSKQWTWRGNYRVWQAAREIFLNPESYLEPEQRDDRTPLFRELEDTLLAKEVTEETILDAYGRYLRGFEELSHLEIAGSYHEKDDKAERDALHLFGVNAADPPVYYYRRVDNARYGVTNPARATAWGPWEPLDVQIPVRKVSPVVYQGQLYAFWVRYTTTTLNRVESGASKFAGYQHRATVEFTRRRLDGSWTPPQKLRLTERPFDARGDGVILDPLVPRTVTTVPILWFELRLYSNFQPLYDNRVHEHPQDGYTLRGFMWDQVLAAAVGGVSLRGADFQMWSPVDLYRLTIGPRIEDFMKPGDGVPWLNPEIFLWLWLFTGGKFDLASLLPPRMIWSQAGQSNRVLHSTAPGLPLFDTYTFAHLLLDEERIRHYTRPPHAQTTAPRWVAKITDAMLTKLVPHPIGEVPLSTTLDVVNGSVGDLVMQTPTDALYLQQGAGKDGRYLLRRLRTTVSGDIGDTLYNVGLERLLATTTQLDLKEHAHGLTLDASQVQDASGTGGLDFKGPMGVYLGEIFFHVPWLIASYFNSQGDYEQAERWYRRIFDPTSAETITGIDPSLPPEEQRRRSLDRVWRYREFRRLDAARLRQQLVQQATIDTWHLDPFNPHAIARQRLSAYQKAIVMKYVDNLLDWGDELFALAFARSNPEYLREATQKYVTAQELLGPRPAQLGDCGEGVLASKTFSAIKAATVAGGSEFLIEVESLVLVSKTGWSRSAGAKGRFVPLSAESAAAATAELYSTVILADQPAPVPIPVPVPRPAGDGDGVGVPAGTGAGPGRPRARALPRWDALPAESRIRAARLGTADATVAAASGTPVSAQSFSAAMKWQDVTESAPIWLAFTRQIGPAFCIPRNARLLDCWDRVEDRLYKLRHCLDPDGVPRQLPLFAPRIDPGLLARARAAGLTLDDALATTGGDVPPFRFQYLVDKARIYAATTQALGGALLTALERRDIEELTRLRNTHQRNVLALTTEVKDDELKLAKEGVTLARRRLAAAEYRRDYYAGLLSAGLLPSEAVQQETQILSAELRTYASIVDTVAAIAHLIPQAGSPFAMKYGGLEAGLSSTAWAMVLNRTADVADLVSTIAGLSAGQERREQGWEHQRTLGQHDVNAAQSDLTAAELRQEIAERAVELHRTAIAQHDEIMELTRDKFSNLGLYTYLTRSLQRLHREAYTNALAMATLAERAYRFERPGDTTVFVGGEWDGARSGLLAGDRLTVALQRMERRFVETGDRSQEMNQSFSLPQLDPAALVTLKETGRCEFSVPELYLDLFYPGQYRRRIRSVRLTIPCITGPYTNVSARLSLVNSHMRAEPRLGAAALVEVPPTRTRSVAMSTAQGDAGVFELSFRDDRYMPFEGAGAVSRWRLELPSAVRPFDYHSITDVILNLSYTAEEDGALREQVESRTATVTESLLSHLRATNLTRVFSLRQEFSSAFNRLVRSPANTPVTLEITDRHFPLFLSGRNLTVTASRLVLGVTSRTQALGTIAFTVDGTAVTGFPEPGNPPSSDDEFGGLPVHSFEGQFRTTLKGQHTLTATNAGDLGPDGPGAPVAGAPLFDEAKLRDMLLVVTYRPGT